MSGTPDDVIVVGAGPAGALAALRLARAGARVRVFDRARFPRPKLCGDTLNPGAMRVLAEADPTLLVRVRARGVPLDGMLVTGPGAAVRGRYGVRGPGYAVPRVELDEWLIHRAADAGATIEEAALVDRAVVDAAGRTRGVVLTHGRCHLTHHARLVIAADGRRSRLARGLGLTRPARPRRWAVGAYFRDVEAMADAGEMHIRRGHYIGVAPMPDGLVNVCLVAAPRPSDRRWSDPRRLLIEALRHDTVLAPRFAQAHLVTRPVALGPMAAETRGAGSPGLLLAGDAAGFVDPMTGDGLHLAMHGARLAADVALDVLAGRVRSADAPAALTAARRRAFATKLRVNRALRALVDSVPAVTAATIVARGVPSLFEQLICYAGDCGAPLDAR